MSQDTILNNVPIKDLNLDLTDTDVSTLSQLDEESQKALGVDEFKNPAELSEQNNPIPDKNVGVLTSPTSVASLENVQQVSPSTTEKPTPEQIVGSALDEYKRKSQFATYGPVSGGFNVPEEQTRRFREGPGGYVFGRDNEDAQAKAEGFWTNLGKGLIRLPASIGIKTGQTVGYLEGLLNPTNWGDGYLQNASNNAITHVFNQLDEDMKNQWLPVYQKTEAEGKGFWWRATHDMNFWTSDAVDGAAFMISAFAPGAILSKVGFGTRLARGLSALKWGSEAAESAVQGASTAENYIINAQKIWATRTDRISQWALSVAGESMFEATESGDNIKRALKYDENGQVRVNPDTGLPYSDQEIRTIVGSHMKSSFLSNAAILSVSNAMELKWMRSIFGKTEGAAVTEALRGGHKLGDVLAFDLEHQGISKLLNSKAGTFLKAIASGTLTEGFYEENMQLAIQRVNEKYGVEGKVAQFKDTGEMLGQAFKQAVNAILGNDPEASLNIGLGGLMGGPMKAYSDIKQQKQNKAFTEAAVKFYNEAQQSWLKFGNIFETRTVTTKDENGNDKTTEEVILDDKGRAKINQAKLTNVINNFNNANSAVDASNQTNNKLKRDILRDNAWADFVKAHIDLGIENTLIHKLDSISKTNPADLVKLGFIADDTTSAQIEKYKSLTNLIIKQNKLLNDDVIFETTTRGKIRPEEEARKNRMIELATHQAVYRHLLEEIHNDSVQFKNDMLKTVEGHVGLNDDFVDQLNSLQLKINSQRQFLEELEMGKKRPIELAMAKSILNDLLTEMDDLKKNNSETLKTLTKDTDGFYNYEKSVRNDANHKLIRNRLYGRYARIGQLSNHIKQVGLEWAKYADTKNGKKNFAEYIDNVITKPFTDAMERAERGKSTKLTDEERKQKRKQRQEKEYEVRTPWVKKGTNATFLYRYEDDDRVAEDIMEYYDIKDGETAALGPMVDKMISNPYTDPYVRKILQKFRPYIKDGAKVKFDTKQTVAPGYYEYGTATITIDPELHEAKMSFEGVMLHELIHLLTSDELAFDSKFTRDIEKLYDYAKKNLESRGIDPAYYGFSNIHEFLAEAYSNPEFQKELQGVPGVTGRTTVWQDFLQALADFFKKTFDLDIKPSVLDDIFYKVEEYLNDDVYKEAVRQYKKNGLTQQEIENYSKRELIDMAIKDELISPDLLTKPTKSEEEPGPTPVETTVTTIDQEKQYSYKGKNYSIFILGDDVNMINPTDPEDSYAFGIEEFKNMMKSGTIKYAATSPTEIPDTFEEYFQNVYNQAKTKAESMGRPFPSFDDWAKFNRKFEEKRYEKLRNPKPTDEEEGEDKVDYTESIKVNNEFTDDDANLYKIASVIPGKTVSYVKITPSNQSSIEKEPYDQFLKKLQDKDLTLIQTQFEQDDEKNNVKDFVQNDRFNKNGLNNTISDNNIANLTFQEGRKQVSPHNSLANRTDDFEFQLSGSEIRYVRTGVNKNYVFDIATGNFIEGASITYRVMTSDFPEVENNITGEKYDRNAIFDSSGKVKQSMYDFAPIGVYATIDGKETLIGTVHEPQWIERKMADKYINIVIPEDELDQKVPATLKKELEKNRKLRNFIFENHNKDPKFEMNGIVEGKSIGILRTVSQPGTLKERVNPKIGDGGTSNRHGMFGIVRNGEIQVSRNVTIDNVEDTKTFTDDIDNQSGVPVLLVPTPRGTYFPAFIKLPNVNEGQANFIIESWKAFTGQQENPQLIKAVYDAMKMEMSQGKPDIGVLQSYINHYITILESDPISGIGTGTDISRNIARLNITNDGHIYLQSKLGDEWFNNDGKPIVTANQLPANIMAHLGNLLTTIKFTDTKNKNLAGINNTAKIPFITIEDGKVKTTSMTYNQYIMQGASTYIEEGIESKNKEGDWVYFANPVIKMSTNTDAIVVEPKAEVEVGDKFETPPASITPTAPAADIEAKKAEIEKRRQIELQIVDKIKQLKTFFERGVPKDDVYKGKSVWAFEQEELFKAARESLTSIINAKYDAELAALEGKPAEKKSTEISKETELTNKLNSIQKGSIGFSSKTQPGTVRYTQDGTKVEFVKSQRDKFGRGSEIYNVTRPDGTTSEVFVDYKQRPTSGFSDEKEVVFQAKYSENPKQTLEELRSVQDKAGETKPSEVNVDDIFANLDRIATANEMTDEQINEQKKKC